jgi:hypothetical protein
MLVTTHMAFEIYGSEYNDYTSWFRGLETLYNNMFLKYPETSFTVCY